MAWAEFRETVNGTARHYMEEKKRWGTGDWYAVGYHPTLKTPNGRKKRISEPAGAKVNLKDALRTVEDIECGRTLLESDIKAGKTLVDAIAKYKTEIIKKSKSHDPEHVWLSYQLALDKYVAFLKKQYPNQELYVATNKRVDILDFRTELLERHNINGVITLLTKLRSFFSFCVERGDIASNPAKECLKGYKPTDVGCCVEDDQVRHILKTVFESAPNRVFEGERRVFADIVQVALMTGLREHELGKFWVLADKRIIGVIGKGGKERLFAIHDDLWPILVKYVATGKNVPFASWGPGRIRTRWWRLLKRARKTMSLPKRIRFHDLRHTYGTNMSDAGAPPKHIQEVMGHDDPKTTDRYLHGREEQVRKSINKIRFGFLDNGPAPSFHVA